jgi:hypothetical protein
LRTYLKTCHHKKRVCGVAQGVGPDFKPQYHQKKKRKKKRNSKEKKVTHTHNSEESNNGKKGKYRKSSMRMQTF